MKLDYSITELPFVGSVYKHRLEKLDIKTLEDLLLHIPHRYLDFRLVSNISMVQPGETVTIKGKIASIKNQYTKSGKKIQIAEITDSTGKITAVWFNQPFLIRNFKIDESVSLSGKVDWFGRTKAIISPEYELGEGAKNRLHTGRLVPVYPETYGVTSKWLRRKVADAWNNLEGKIEEYLPGSVIDEFNFPDLTAAYRFVHFPKNPKEAEKGKERLAFNELLYFQYQALYRKNRWRESKIPYQLKVDSKTVDEFIDKLPFSLTRSQKRSIAEINKDLEKNYPMNRLLEGDVGSGKTVVAACAVYLCFKNSRQSVVMAPTQILAQQHADTLKQLFAPFGVKISLVTADTKKEDFAKADVYVGTHALIHRRLDMEEVGLVVIDEQHRFGVRERGRLVKKVGRGFQAPHVLTMTATPIPRTVALVFYGDLELSTLDELPSGRKKTATWIVPPQKREAAYGWIKKKIKDEKIQVFVVCPLIEESEIETMQTIKAVKIEYERLRNIFNDLRLGLLHGKLKAKEKSTALDSFRKGKINILVATPVIEVGIDVPNATVMVIEAGERFGLAQLHQLRGRVGRGEKKSYCIVFAESASRKALARLSALQKTLSGFELAEMDLKLRGPGEIFGLKQHGFPELKIASWQDTELIKAARRMAEKIITNPKKYSKLIRHLEKKEVVAN